MFSEGTIGSLHVGGKHYSVIDQDYAFALSREVHQIKSALVSIAESDDIDNALDPARNKRVAAAALAQLEGRYKNGQPSNSAAPVKMRVEQEIT